MAAVTAEQVSSTRALNNAVEEVVAITTSATVYVGALGAIVTSTGRVTNATAAASRTAPCEIVEIINRSGAYLSAGTGNTAGTVLAKIRYGHQMLLGVATAARTFSNVGKNVFVKTNVDVTDTTDAGTATLRVRVGQVVQFTSSTKDYAWVWLRNFSSTGAT